jgi:ATP-binding cassette subfamily F protein 3
VLTASGLAKAFGGRELWRDVTFRLVSGRRVALVGGNGTGKTTLLEILVAHQQPDAGDVFVESGARVGYLPQDLPGDQHGSVLEEVLAGADQIAGLQHRLTELEHLLATATGDAHLRAIDEYGTVQSRFETLGGYAIEAEAHRLLAGLGFTPDQIARPVPELSGGWRMRVALARLLLSAPDVLLLDEPTNHLDVDSVAWLEEYLHDWNGALLFVSHDRDFIDGVATHIIELAEGTALEYTGGFAEFVVQREERLERLAAAAANQAKKVAQVERFIERFRYKATKARQVQSRLKTLQKLDRIAVPTRKELAARFGFPEPRRSSRVVLEAKGVSGGYDGTVVVSNVDLAIERGRKVAFVGPNGAGKTTVLRLLLGELAPLTGTVERGANVDVARFEQHQAEVLDQQKSVYNEFRGALPKGDPRNTRTVLGSFGFSGDAAEQLVAELSGGEQTRLALAKAMATPVNLLVLDEPTNHLDLPSCDLLEEALIAYPGTVLLVTHDRHLIRSVADALVEVRGGVVRWHEGVDERVLGIGGQPVAVAPRKERVSTAEARPKEVKAEQKRSDAEARNRRHQATRDLRKDLQKVERAWEQAEARVVQLQTALADPAIYADPARVGALVAEHEAAKDDAARLMNEWERLTLALESAG